MKILSIFWVCLILTCSTTSGYPSSRNGVEVKDRVVLVPSNIQKLSPTKIIDSLGGLTALGVSAGDGTWAPGAIIGYYIFHRFLENFEDISSLFTRSNCCNAFVPIELVRYDDFISNQFAQMSGTSYTVLQSLFHWLQKIDDEEYETNFTDGSLNYEFGSGSSYPGVRISIRLPDEMSSEGRRGETGTTTRNHGGTSTAVTVDDEGSGDLGDETVVSATGAVLVEDAVESGDSSGREDDRTIDRRAFGKVLNTNMFKAVLPSGRLDYLEKGLANGDIMVRENGDNSISFFIKSIGERRRETESSQWAPRQNILEVKVEGVDVSTGEIREKTIIKKEKTVWDGLNGIGDVVASCAIGAAAAVDYYVFGAPVYSPYAIPGAFVAQKVFEQLPAFWNVLKKCCCCCRGGSQESAAKIDFFDYLLGESQYLNAATMRIITYCHLVLEDAVKEKRVIKKNMWDGIEYSVISSTSEDLVKSKFTLRTHGARNNETDSSDFSFRNDIYHNRILGAFFGTDRFPRQFLHDFNRLMETDHVVGWRTVPEGRQYVFRSSRHESCELEGDQFPVGSPVVSVTVSGNIAGGGEGIDDMV